MLDSALTCTTFLDEGVIERCKCPSKDSFYSILFTRFKKDRSARVIVNLSELKEFVEAIPLKMDKI